MNVAIVQYDNRSNEALGTQYELVQINAAYAEKHGYTHIFCQDIDSDMVPWWGKVFAVLGAINNGFDIVLWLDSDAVVHDFNRTIESFFEADELIIYSSDHGIWPEFFNAGVFFVKKEAKHIIEEWTTFYNRDFFIKEHGHWKYCFDRWGGDAFEQGTFTKQLVPKYGTALKKIDWKIIQSPYPIDASFVVHFAGEFRDNAKMYVHLKPILSMQKDNQTEGKPMSRRVAIISPSYDGKIVCDHALALVTIFRRAAVERPDLHLSLSYWMGEALLQKARNNLFCDAYDEGVDDIVFLDVDQGFDAQAFFDVLDHPVDVVGVTARMKTDEERYTHRPEDPLAHRWDEQLGLLEVEYLATGFIKLSRKAMKALYDNSPAYNDGKERRLICDVQIINGGMISEDIQIGKKLHEAGIKLYMDINHTCTHFGMKKYSGNYHEFYATNMMDKILKIKNK